jgi:hypothetical protein
VWLAAAWPGTVLKLSVATISFMAAPLMCCKANAQNSPSFRNQAVVTKLAPGRIRIEPDTPTQNEKINQSNLVYEQ